MNALGRRFGKYLEKIADLVKSLARHKDPSIREASVEALSNAVRGTGIAPARDVYVHQRLMRLIIISYSLTIQFRYIARAHTHTDMGRL